jgi:hypothetical protein
MEAEKSILISDLFLSSYSSTTGGGSGLLTDNKGFIGKVAAVLEGFKNGLLLVFIPYKRGFI